MYIQFFAQEKKHRARIEGARTREETRCIMKPWAGPWGVEERERELARIPLNFEYPRSKSRRKMLIGGDSLIDDV